MAGTTFRIREHTALRLGDDGRMAFLPSFQVMKDGRPGSSFATRMEAEASIERTKAEDAARTHGTSPYADFKHQTRISRFDYGLDGDEYSDW